MTDAGATVMGPSRQSRAWAFVGVLGELLITLGVVLLLLVVYQLWWTNVAAQRATDSAAAQLQESWSRPPQGGGTSPTEAPQDEDEDAYTQPEFGAAFALMYIPRLSDKVWATPVVEGVAAADLARGIGHYPGTAMPGEVGNFAVAAHRATNGEPFRDIDRVQAGDEVYVETRDEWFTYRLERDQMVTPRDGWVLDPVPGEPGEAPTQPLITLTTCHPRWGSTQRWIWWGRLVDRIDKEAGEVPEVIRAGR